MNVRARIQRFVALSFPLFHFARLAVTFEFAYVRKSKPNASNNSHVNSFYFVIEFSI